MASTAGFPPVFRHVSGLTIDMAGWLKSAPNPRLDLPYDMITLLGSVVCWAAVHFLFSRLVSRPLCRYLIKKNYFAAEGAAAKPAPKLKPVAKTAAEATESAALLRRRSPSEMASAVVNEEASGDARRRSARAVSSSTTPTTSTKPLKPPKVAVTTRGDAAPVAASTSQLSPIPHAVAVDRKFRVSLWKFFAFGLSLSIGLYLLATEDWFLRPSTYFHGWPNMPMSQGIKLYYKIAFGNYLYAALTMWFEPKQKDFSVMLAHHCITLFLIYHSYVHGMHRVGAAILLVHEVSDPWMEIAKCCLYTGFTKAADALFATFAASFIISRTIVFPLGVVLPLWWTAVDAKGVRVPNGRSDLFNTLYVGLWILQAFHVYWSMLIVDVAAKALRTGNVNGDNRDSDSDEL